MIGGRLRYESLSLLIMQIYQSHFQSIIHQSVYFLFESLATSSTPIRILQLSYYMLNC